MGLSGPGIDGNEGVLCILPKPQLYWSPHQCRTLVEGGFYPSAQMQLEYGMDQADWARIIDGNLTDSTTQDESGPGSNGNVEVWRILCNKQPEGHVHI